MISDEKQFEFVSAQISFFGQRQLDVFKLFLQLFSAIVGGSIWISLNKEILDANKAKLAWLSIILVWLILFIISVFAGENLRSWHGYRKASARLDDDNPNQEHRIPPPRWWPRMMWEIVAISGMAVAALLFSIFNPLWPPCR